MPKAPIRRPPPQQQAATAPALRGPAPPRPPPRHQAATAPALRGPARSSQPPQIAAETPSSTKNRVYIHPRLATFQSQLVVNNSCHREISGQAFGAVSPMARDSGSQNTEKP